MTAKNKFGSVRVSDTAVLSSAIALNNATSVTIATANADRRFFTFNNNDSNQKVWLKLQAASVDDDAKGIFIDSDSAWTMPSNAIYTGEICAIAIAGSPNGFYTEY